MNSLGNGLEPIPFDFRFRQDFFEAAGANYPIFMFRNAFTAIGMPALRATSDGLAQGVVQAALLGKAAHTLTPADLELTVGL